MHRRRGNIAQQSANPLIVIFMQFMPELFTKLCCRSLHKFALASHSNVCSCSSDLHTEHKQKFSCISKRHAHKVSFLNTFSEYMAVNLSKAHSLLLYFFPFLGLFNRNATWRYINKFACLKVELNHSFDCVFLAHLCVPEAKESQIDTNTQTPT